MFFKNVEVFSKLRRNIISSNDYEEFLEALEHAEGAVPAFRRRENIFIAKIKKHPSLYMLRNIPIALQCGEKFVPTIFMMNVLNSSYNLPTVRIHEGATTPILNGAHIMIPGIYFSDEKKNEFEKKDLVAIKKPEEGGIYIAIAEAMMSSREMREQKKGLGLVPVHILNDSLWKYTVSILLRQTNDGENCDCIFDEE